MDEQRMRASSSGGASRRSGQSKGRGMSAIILLVICIVAICGALIGQMLAMMGLSRAREYLAEDGVLS